MSHLPNYLRSHRKRLALSQQDVALLLGTQSGTKMCRFERFVREPSLEVALALAVIFNQPLEAVFAGVHRRIEKQVAERAKALGYRLEKKKPAAQARRRRETLHRLAALSKTKR